MKGKRIGLIAFLLMIAIGGGVWWYFPSSPTETSADISASGFIEAKNVAIAPEVGGRIVKIAADEGDRVEAGTTLVSLDDSLLMAQMEVAKANLNQANLSLQGAKKAWEDALALRENPLELNGRIIAAEGQLEIARVSLRNALQLTVPNWYQEHSARAAVDAAEKTLQNLLAIRDNPQALDAAVNQAHSAYLVAGAAVKTAEANVGLIQVQSSKLSCRSPVSGVVSARYAEAGEITQPGSPILTITMLDEVTLNAYVPESKIGLVKLRQKVLVSVDSYPGESFAGEVVYISPQAQFTPRNVQLKEEREKTVFPVKIRLGNPGHKLKPGMPADARIIVS